MLLVHFKLSSYYSFLKIKSRIRLTTFFLFRTMYLIFLKSLYSSLITSDELCLKNSKSFVISSRTIALTVVKAPMAHKKWSKEQVSITTFYYRSSITITNFRPFDSPQTLFLFYKLLINCNIAYDNPASLLSNLSISLPLKKKISYLS